MSPNEFYTSILKEGWNCLGKRRAEKLAFLVDANAYYRAFVKAVSKAEKSVYIAGWEIDSRVRLLRGSNVDEEAYRLGPFLNRVVSAKPDLEAHILVWDFTILFALDREPFLIFKLGWNTHERVHFRLDSAHPVGASHHQKIVVIDDRLAFVGGLDLTKKRWDVRSHELFDPRRTDPLGKPYRPFHDVQVIMTGDAAAALGDIFRDRWRRSSHEILRPPEGGAEDPWPAGLVPELNDVDVGIARTYAPYLSNPEVREIERLYLDSIAAARNTIYIENQYVTSDSIAQALAERLREPRGPEVVAIVPKCNGGWLEERTLGVRREKILRDLLETDRYDRFGFFYPCRRTAAFESVKVHAKTQVVDDTLLHVGSANLTNRSMGLDSECDLAIESEGDVRVSRVIARFRDDLLAEHLDTARERVEETYAQTGSLLRTIEDLSGNRKTLLPLEYDGTAAPEVTLYAEAADPEKPMDPAELAALLAPDEDEVSSRSRWIALIGIVAMVIALALAWRWGPLSEWVDAELLSAWMAEMRTNRLGALVVLLALYALTGLVMVPVTLLIAATALAFEPAWSFVYATAGCMTSALVCYAVGATFGKGFVREVAGAKVNRLSKRLARRGLWAVITLRLVPVAPFTVVNLVMGASHIKLKDYIIGSLVGLAPGILAISVYGESLLEVIKNPQPANIALFVMLTVAIIAGAYAARRVVKWWDGSGRRSEEDEDFG